jgi:hypothetical protein
MKIMRAKLVPGKKNVLQPGNKIFRFYKTFLISTLPNHFINFIMGDFFHIGEKRLQIACCISRDGAKNCPKTGDL